MPAGALALALGAAVVHAVWNLLLARAEDTEAATAVALGLSVVLFALPALLLWEIEAGAWPYVAASAAFEVGYVATLAGGLRRGELSVVYPLARGLGAGARAGGQRGGAGRGDVGLAGGGRRLVAAGVVLVRGLEAAGGAGRGGCWPSPAGPASRATRSSTPTAWTTPRRCRTCGS